MQFDKLNGVVERYEEINQQLMDPYVTSNPQRYKELMKEHKHLTPLMDFPVMVPESGKYPVNPKAALSS